MVFIKLMNKGLLIVADDKKGSNSLDYSKGKKVNWLLEPTNHRQSQCLFLFFFFKTELAVHGLFSSNGPITILVRQPGSTVN